MVKSEQFKLPSLQYFIIIIYFKNFIKTPFFIENVEPAFYYFHYRKSYKL